MLVAFSLGALACRDVSNTPANKGGGGGVDTPAINLPNVSGQTAKRSGVGGATITLKWTNPSTSEMALYDDLVVYFTPEAPSVQPQPIEIAKTETSYDVLGLVPAGEYTFVIKTRKNMGDTYVESNGQIATVGGEVANPSIAIPAALKAATGAGTRTDPRKVVLDSVDLSILDNMKMLMSGLTNSLWMPEGSGIAEFYDLDLSTSVMYLWGRDKDNDLLNKDKVVKLTLPETLANISNSTGDNAAFDGWLALEEITGINVQTIGERAFRFSTHNQRAKLKKASFPHATKILNYAFDWGVNLETIEAPEVKTIGAYAFSGCYKLEGALFPECISIDKNAFIYCQKLNETNVNFNKLETLGDEVFRYYIYSTSNQNIPVGTTSPLFTTTLKSGEVQNDGSLKSPESIFPVLKNIGAHAFYQTTKLEVAYFPEAVQVGPQAFQGIAKLTTAVFPKVKIIRYATFYKNYKLKYLKFDNALVIGKSAFYRNLALTEIPSTAFPLVTHIAPATLAIGQNAVTGTDTPPSDAEPEDIYTLDEVGPDAFRDCFGLTKVSFPRVTDVGAGSFLLNFNLTTVILPKLKSVGDWAFSMCEKLDPESAGFDFGSQSTGVVLNRLIFASENVPYDITAKAEDSPAPVDDPNGTFTHGKMFYPPKFTSMAAFENVTAAGDGAFRFVSSELTDVNVSLPKLVTAGTDLFKGWSVDSPSNIETVDLPVLTTVGVGAFINCPDITTISAPNLQVVPAELFSGYKMTSVTTTPPPSVLVTVDISGATSLGNSAFNGCVQLEQVKGTASIADGVDLPLVTTIGTYAFSNCSNLTQVSLPQAATIDIYAFQNCSNLTQVILSQATSQAATIGNYAFYNCVKLMSVDMPQVTTIGTNAFQNCEELVSVDMPRATTMGTHVFLNCLKLPSVSLPLVTTIGNNAFQNCPELTSVSLPKVTTIPAAAFYGCLLLATVDIPAAGGMANNAFAKCPALTTITVGAFTQVGDAYPFGNAVADTTTVGTGTLAPGKTLTIHTPSAEQAALWTTWKGGTVTPKLTGGQLTAAVRNQIVIDVAP
jgi:hypothetical protein